MTKLQERLDHPTCVREVLDVMYSDTKIFNVPYMSTEPSVTTGTRGTAYTFSDFALTTEALDISQKYMEPVFIDRADLAQMPLVSQMTIGYVCQHYSKAYIQHLSRSHEILFNTLMSVHNEYFIVKLVDDIRLSIENGTFYAFRDAWLLRYYA